MKCGQCFYIAELVYCCEFYKFNITVPCPAGTFYDRSRTTCTKCYRGSYQPMTSQSKCIPCPPQQNTPRVESISLSECEGMNTYQRT